MFHLGIFNLRINAWFQIGKVWPPWGISKRVIELTRLDKMNGDQCLVQKISDFWVTFFWHISRLKVDDYFFFWHISRVKVDDYFFFWNISRVKEDDYFNKHIFFSNKFNHLFLLWQNTNLLTINIYMIKTNYSCRYFLHI